MKNSPEHLVLCSESSDYNQGEAEGKKVAKEAKKKQWSEEERRGFILCPSIFLYLEKLLGNIQSLNILCDDNCYIKVLILTASKEEDSRWPKSLRILHSDFLKKGGH